MKKIVLYLMTFIFSFFIFFQATPLEAQFGKLAKKILPKKEKKLTTEEIVAGLKDALKIGIKQGIKQVGKTDGYYKNNQIRIPMPQELSDFAKALRKIGLGSKVDELELKMNRGAEEAAPKALDIFWNAIKSMSFADAKNILFAKNDDAATRYFENKTRSSLYQAFFPIMKRTLDSLGVTKLFKFLLEKHNQIPFVKKKSYDLDQYATNKALDGLFWVLAKEEAKIRKNPAARVTAILKKVFG